MSDERGAGYVCTLCGDQSPSYPDGMIPALWHDCREGGWFLSADDADAHAAARATHRNIAAQGPRRPGDSA